MPLADPDPDDPTILVGVALPAGAEAARDMAWVFAEEFARLGYDDAQLLRLFRSPFYAGAHDALRRLGERYGGDKAAAAPEAASLLQSMTADHLRGLRVETRFLLQAAGPVLGPAPGGSAEVPGEPDQGLFERAQRTHALLMRLFTTAGAGQDAGTLARSALPELLGLERAVPDTGPAAIVQEIK